MRFLFLDTETTGLDPDLHEVIQLGAIPATWDPTRRRFVAGEAWEAWFAPRMIENASPEALKVNGYPERWEGRVLADRVSAMERLIREAEGAILAGHNVSFDIAFLDVETVGATFGAKRLSKVASHRKLCTQSLAFLDVLAGRVPSAGLAALHEHYKCLFTDPGAQHTAIADAWASLRLAEIYAARWCGPAPWEQLGFGFGGGP